MKTLARQCDKAEILARLRAVGPKSQRRWGRMSAHQMICHLSRARLAYTASGHLSIRITLRKSAR